MFYFSFYYVVILTPFSFPLIDSIFNNMRANKNIQLLLLLIIIIIDRYFIYPKKRKFNNNYYY